MSVPSKHPHLVIDVRALTRQRDGSSTYILELVPRLLSLARDWKRTLIVNQELVHLVRGWECEVAFSESPHMRPGQHIMIPWLCRRLRPDVFFYPAHDPPLFSVGAPLVMTVQDVTLFLLRPYFETWDMPKRAYLRSVLVTSLRRAEHVIAASQATKDGIGKVFGKTLLSKTSVVHHAVAQPPSQTSGANKHVLYLGTDRPHKNLLRLIDGYAMALQGKVQIPPLVLAGGLRDAAKVRAALARVNISHAVTVTGHVSDDVVDDLMRDAIVLVVPSIAEGFGFPILEAMARGLPVITSDRSACKEIAADAALTVDPFDPGAIAAAITQIAGDQALRTKLGDLGRARAANFSWDASAQATLEVIQMALRSTPDPNPLPKR